MRWPDDDQEAGLRFLAQLTREHDLRDWLVIPTGDLTAAFLSHHSKALPGGLISSAPPWSVFRWAHDKRLSYLLAADHGVPHPATISVIDRREVENYRGPFPVILKPSTRPKSVRRKAWQANNHAELLALYDQVHPLLAPDPVLIQELIPGDGRSQYSFGALCRDGEPLAWVVAQRLRQQPMDFGRLSTFVESTRDAEVEERSFQLLSALGISGLVELEYKRDGRDGSLRLLDINARVWGWHTLTQQAGIDFPHLLWRLFDGELPRAEPAPAGLRWVRLTSDLSAAAPELARGRLALRPYVASLRTPHERAIFANDDPLPGLLEVPLMGSVALGRLVDTARSSTHRARMRPASEGTSAQL